MRKQSSADCCRSFYDTNAQLTSVWYKHAKHHVHYVTYIYANTDWRIFCKRKLSHACMAYTRVKSVLLRYSKWKGQYTDVKSGSSISVGPSLKPQSQIKQNSRDTVPLIRIRGFKAIRLQGYELLGKTSYEPTRLVSYETRKLEDTKTRSDYDAMSTGQVYYASHETSNLWGCETFWGHEAGWLSEKENKKTLLSQEALLTWSLEDLIMCGHENNRP